MHFGGLGMLEKRKSWLSQKIWNIVDHYPAILGGSSMMSLVMWVPKPLKCQRCFKKKPWAPLVENLRTWANS